tara:strand:+ start:508 stop:807 length:300 start_codon:yes stop_codon:yes gene_type:complete
MKEYIYKQYLNNILDHLEINLNDLLNKTKERRITEARYMLYYLCNQRGMSNSDIQSYMKTQGFEVPLNNIQYGIERMNDIITNDSDYKHIVRKLKEIEL